MILITIWVWYKIYLKQQGLFFTFFKSSVPFTLPYFTARNKLFADCVVVCLVNEQHLLLVELLILIIIVVEQLDLSVATPRGFTMNLTII